MRLTEILNEDIKGQFYAALKGNQPVILAYGEGSGRNLDIIGVPVTLDQWVKTMDIAVGGGYNDFEPKPAGRDLKDALRDISISPDELKFIPAREGSVALYITGPEHYLRELGEYLDEANFAQEVHFYPDERTTKGGTIPGPVLRLWWD